MMSFPADLRRLPDHKFSKPGVFEAELLNRSEIEGWMMGQSSTGEKRRYIFRAVFKENTINVTVSAGDPSIGVDIFNRNRVTGANVPETYRSLKGLPPKSGNHLKAQAARIAKHIKEEFFKQQSFLEKQFLSSADVIRVRPPSATINRGETRRCGDWVVVQNGEAGNARYAAKYIKPNASNADADAVRW